MQKFKIGANAFLLGWMDCSLLYVPQFINDFFFNLVLSHFLLLLLSFIVVVFSFQNFLFPYWAVFPAGAFGFLVSSSPSWGLQSGM